MLTQSDLEPPEDLQKNRQISIQTNNLKGEFTPKSKLLIFFPLLFSHVVLFIHLDCLPFFGDICSKYACLLLNIMELHGTRLVVL